MCSTRLVQWIFGNFLADLELQPFILGDVGPNVAASHALFSDDSLSRRRLSAAPSRHRSRPTIATLFCRRRDAAKKLCAK
jgi:hypothetical protein